jgi:hypothetical protein
LIKIHLTTNWMNYFLILSKKRYPGLDTIWLQWLLLVFG